jgi:hypothetical protein
MIYKSRAVWDDRRRFVKLVILALRHGLARRIDPF